MPRPRHLLGTAGYTMTPWAAAPAMPAGKAELRGARVRDTPVLGMGGLQGTTEPVPIPAVWCRAVEGGGCAGGWLPPAACSACSAC